MEVDWLVQLLTVVLTLLVVLVVKDVNAWWNSSRSTSSAHEGPMLGTQKTEEVAVKDAATAEPSSGDGATTPAVLDQGSKDDGAPCQTKDAGDGASQVPATKDDGDGASQLPASPCKDGTTDTAGTPQKPAVDGPPQETTKVTSPASKLQESVMQELQECHTTVKNFAANMSRLLNGITSVAPNLAKVQTELENSQKAASALEATVAKSLAKMDKAKDNSDDLKELVKRTSGLESIVGAVTAKMGPLAQSVDSFGKSSDSQLKDTLKSVAAVASSSKQQSADIAAHVTAKTALLEAGLKEVLRKITATDYDSHTSVTGHIKDLANQVYELGQELLAALSFQQNEAATQKENLFQMATAMADISEQIRIVRDYCERPVPVAMSSHPTERPPMPPPAYEPNLHRMGPRQLHLDTALPATRPSTVSSVRVDTGDGRSVTIPLS
ncbi:FCPF [Symbiodinium sp. CCMP2592]|nr:FCPF [Symbiodinium sp. CCMP2592]